MARAARTRRRSRPSWRLAPRRSTRRASRATSRRRPFDRGCVSSATARARWTSLACQIACAPGPLCHNRHDGGGTMKFLRMKPGHGEVLLAEGDVDVDAEEERLIEAFREQLDQGMWAAVPLTSQDGRRQAQMVKAFDEIPRDAERVIFFPRAAGGR